MGGGSPTLNQDHSRWHLNQDTDADLNGFATAEDGQIALPINTPVILRFKFSNTGTKSRDVQTSIEFNIDSAGWVNLTTNSDSFVGVPAAVAPSNTVLFSDDQIIDTELLSSPRGDTFVNGRAARGGINLTETVGIQERSEVVFAFRTKGTGANQVSGGESVQFRIVDAAGGGGPFDNYFNTPTAIIVPEIRYMTKGYDNTVRVRM